MTAHTLVTAHVLGSAGVAVAFTACGLCLGLGYFALLRRSVAATAEAGRRGQALVLTLVRLAGAVAFFFLAVHLGALALLSGFVGFLGARTLALRRVRSAS